VCHPGTVSLLVLVPKEVEEVGGGLGEGERQGFVVVSGESWT
jgi:hypothetical protein